MTRPGRPRGVPNPNAGRHRQRITLSLAAAAALHRMCKTTGADPHALVSEIVLGACTLFADADVLPQPDVEPDA